MVAAIIAIITALISYFGSKKAGASDGKAALIAAAAGGGAYYVGTQTDWGKGVISGVEGKWEQIFGPSKEPLLNGDSSPALGPPGSKPVLDKDGRVTRDQNGNILWKVVDSAGNVLESWGPTGTATVIGATALATNDNLKKWIPLGLLVAGVAILT